MTSKTKTPVIMPGEKRKTSTARVPSTPAEVRACDIVMGSMPLPEKWWILEKDKINKS